MNELPEPIPAATLILMRPAPAAGDPQILMIERTRSMAFAAGALVFPGGRVDPEDHAMAGNLPDASEDAADRIAAIRETIEETGVAPGLSPRPGAEAAARLRAGIARGESFEALLLAEGLRIDLDALTAFARWCPNFRETRRFDTMFYIAEAPTGVEATPDTTEATRILWASARKVLAEVNDGRGHAIFPTRRNLERLARFESIADAREDAAAHPVQRITPWVEKRENGTFVCIPEAIGYPVTAEPIETARRR